MNTNAYELQITSYYNLLKNLQLQTCLYIYLTAWNRVIPNSKAKYTSSFFNFVRLSQHMVQAYKHKTLFPQTFTKK